MAIAAVPDYLGKNFDSASPGLRFGMYLPVWNERDWSKIKAKVDDLKKVTRLTTNDQQTLAALRARQQAAAETVDSAQLLCVEALTVSPFATGLGNEHPLENGFAFLNPYGLPYLAGSGVKGVLRKAATELANGLFGGTAGWTPDAIDALFGSAIVRDGEEGGKCGALIFWDVLPEISGNVLKVEVMTAHHSHYLQGTESPHDCGQPNPINFLSVPPGSRFDFHIQCDLPFLARIAPELAANAGWKRLVEAALEHAFDWLGFGAKTAVGYGAMRHDAAASARREAAAAARAERIRSEQARAAMTPAQRAIADFVQYMRGRSDSLKGAVVNPNGAEHNKARELARQAMDSADWSIDDKRVAANTIEEWLPKVVRVDVKEERKRLNLRQLRGDA